MIYDYLIWFLLSQYKMSSHWTGWTKRVFVFLCNPFFHNPWFCHNSKTIKSRAENTTYFLLLTTSLGRALKLSLHFKHFRIIRFMALFAMWPQSILSVLSPKFKISFWIKIISMQAVTNTKNTMKLFI